VSQDKNHDGSDRKPETALEEVLREIEDAENRTHDSAEQRRHRGEAGEAITPNTRAQEESQGD
jgi:adenine-specific DNA methylase